MNRVLFGIAAALLMMGNGSAIAQTSNEDYKLAQAYKRAINRRLTEKKNPIKLTDEQKLEHGLAICKNLNVGVRLSEIRKAFLETGEMKELTEQQKEYVTGYYATVEFYSIYWLCPQHRLQLAEENGI